MLAVKKGRMRTAANEEKISLKALSTTHIPAWHIKSIIKICKRDPPCVNLFKPSVFSWLKLLIKVMDRIRYAFFVCAVFCRWYRWFYYTSGSSRNDEISGKFMHLWRLPLQNNEQNVSHGGLILKIKISLNSLSKKWAFDFSNTFSFPFLWIQTAPSLPTQPVYNSSVNTNADPMMMIEYENVISQLSLPIFRNIFTALLTAEKSSDEYGMRRSQDWQKIASFVMRKFIGRMFMHRHRTMAVSFDRQNWI